jgi:hypothetical protein
VRSEFSVGENRRFLFETGQQRNVLHISGARRVRGEKPESFVIAAK